MTYSSEWRLHLAAVMDILMVLVVLYFDGTAMNETPIPSSGGDNALVVVRAVEYAQRDVA